MSDDNDHIAYLISQAAWAEASTNTKNHPKARKHREIAARLRELAAAEQQLTTATALLGECEPWIDGNLSMSEGEEWTEESKKTMQSLLARVREATKGKT